MPRHTPNTCSLLPFVFYQAARYESGLDNSPMYDGEFFNDTTGHMELYDVGMSSMVAMELRAFSPHIGHRRRHG